MDNKKINRIAVKFLDNPVFAKAVSLFKFGAFKSAFLPYPAPEAVKKILVIKLEGMGDSVYLLEIIHRLKANYSGLKIDVLTTGKVPLFPIFAEASGEFGVISLNPLSPADYYKTIKTIGKNAYDIIVDSTGMPVNVPLMLAFAKTRRTFITGFGTLNIKKSIYGRLEDLKENEHIFDNYLSLFKIFNIPRDKKFTVPVPRRENDNDNRDNAAAGKSAPVPPASSPAGAGAAVSASNPEVSVPMPLPLQPPLSATEISALPSSDCGGNARNADADADAAGIILVLSSNSGGLLHRKLPLAGSVKLIKLLKEQFKGRPIGLLGGPDDYGYLEEIIRAEAAASFCPAPASASCAAPPSEGKEAPPPSPSASLTPTPLGGGGIRRNENGNDNGGGGICRKVNGTGGGRVGGSGNVSGNGSCNGGVKIEKTKNIEEAMVLLRSSFLNICIDSGLMHIASLLNPATYCLFGYSDPKNYLPFNNIGYFKSTAACSPCVFYKMSACADLKCMDAVDIDAVMDDIRLKFIVLKK